MVGVDKKKDLARKSGYRNSMQLEEKERERKCGGCGDEGGGGDGRRGGSGERVAAAVPKEVTAAAYSASDGSEEEASEEAEEKVIIHSFRVRAEHNIRNEATG